MTIKTLAAKGLFKRAIARQLDVCEGTVRHHLRRMQAGMGDGRARRQQRAAALSVPIDHWLGQQQGALNLAALQGRLVAEHDYRGSPRSQRHAPEQDRPGFEARDQIGEDGGGAGVPGSRAHRESQLALGRCTVD